MSVAIGEQLSQEAARVLRAEAQALKDAADRLESQDDTAEGYQKAVYLLYNSLERGGKIVLTGVGKSGKIAQKICVTLQSTGSCAVFLHPVEALHGDLGILNASDVVVALSYSGNTEEVLNLVPSIKHRGLPLIGVGGHPKSKLGKVCDAWIDGFVPDGEAASHLPAPTSSTTLALALGDALAITLSQLRGFGKEHFAINHPGGALGRQLLLKVKDVMITRSDIPTCEATATLDRVICELSKRPKAGCILVVEAISPPSLHPILHHSRNSTNGLNASTTGSPSLNGATATSLATTGYIKLLGVITNGDLRRAMAFREQIFELQARDIMSDNFVTCSTEDLASEARRLMEERDSPVSKLPVLDKKNVWSGVITLRSLEGLL
ncbi:hypothetical protein BZG36_05275 [Bifiguratus adelaidae]|uniref:SIS domain-containing protein n=1 Tax=Bifiguratus adelaidae TaxID=1938954 RepID=A0A261XU37_9FUNG|nr:hypothetical protein BZG36_05275 [Bifiguratus adelaidae]